MSYSIKYKVTTAALAVSLFVGGLSITATPSAYAAEVSAVNQQAEVTWGVNMRTSSNSSSSVVRMLSKGETVTVIGIASNGWLQVQDKNGKKGYISNASKYTEVVGSSSNNSGSNSGSSSNGSSSGSNSGSSSDTSNSATSSSVEKVIAAGMKYLGTPYEYGSDRNSTATFDCSAFVRQAFKDALGVTLPADSRKQGTYVKGLGNTVTSVSQLKRGDLMFFMSSKGSNKSSYTGINKSTQTITHVGIYLGDGKVLHTYSNAGGGVTTSKVTGTSWEYRFLYGGSAIK
ncbi:C40 family peptidase [Paenibacillus endoradicis]|uniref:C40 family peptidase n=1 Tax=Paenibacillus endoradicis TaxID=2972487 RepID=UPI002159975D|nr:SH3 domain-containing C40 family peptidase [Paenibacillus endoradicis]MCR8659538.1 C40 family peptidase [Paenibacillus endoradicis]